RVSGTMGRGGGEGGRRAAARGRPGGARVQPGPRRVAGDPARDHGATGGVRARADGEGGCVNEPIAVLLMAYGTATGPDDVERYYTDIRGGRAPSPEHLEELRERYAAIGNRCPLLEITRAQSAAIEAELNREDGEGSFRSYLGMKH